MNSRVIYSGVVLVAAILALTVLGHETVPVSSTQTVTITSTSYSPYYNAASKSHVLVQFITSTESSTVCTLYLPITITFSYYTYAYPCGGFVAFPSETFTSTNLFTYPYTGTFVTLTSTIPYGQTLTASSTSFVPASEYLGLSGNSFTLLAIAVIGFLAVLTCWVALKSRKQDYSI